MCQHITVILRNIPGEFSGVAKLLRTEGVNILAFHVSGTGSNSGYAQLVCDDHLQALAVLTGVYHTYAYGSEVLALRTQNVPGSLHEIMSQLSASRINVENAYQTLNSKGEAIIILEPSQHDLVRAKEAFTGSYDLISDLRAAW